MGSNLMLGIGLVEVVVLQVGVLIDWWLLLLVCVELLENMWWYLGIGVMSIYGIMRICDIRWIEIGYVDIGLVRCVVGLLVHVKLLENMWGYLGIGIMLTYGIDIGYVDVGLVRCVVGLL